jgi:hypothetical protein
MYTRFRRLNGIGMIDDRKMAGADVCLNDAVMLMTS